MNLNDVFEYKISLVTNKDSYLAFDVAEFSTLQGMVTSVNCCFYPSGNSRATISMGQAGPKTQQTS